MNISAFTIYLWQLSDKIDPFAKGALGILTLSSIILFIIRACNTYSSEWFKYAGEWRGEDEKVRQAKQAGAAGVLAVTETPFRLSVFGSVIMFLLLCFTPTSNTIAMMVVIPKIAESKIIQQDLPDLYNAAIEALKNKIK